MVLVVGVEVVEAGVLPGLGQGLGVLSSVVWVVVGVVVVLVGVLPGLGQRL